MYTTTFLVKRRSGMTFDAFRAHSTNIHAPLVTALPGLRRYVVAFYPPRESEHAAFDSSATLEFDDPTAFEAALASAAGEAALADQANFLDPSATVVLAGEVGLAFP